MKKFLKLAVASIVVSGVLVSVPSWAQKALKFGIISTESSNNLKEMWEPVLDTLSRKIGITIKPFFASDYAGIIQAMRFKKVDVAWFGNKSGIEAVDRANGEVFATNVAIDGSSGYYSLIITHKKSPLNTLEDMIKNRRSLTLGNGDPNSTSGFLVPGYYVFAKHHIRPTEFKRVVVANHETNLLTVANNLVDVATNNTENLERLRKTKPSKASQIKILWKSPLIPSDPFVWRKDLDSNTKQKIKTAMLGLGKHSAKERELLKGLGYSEFKASSNKQLVPVRKLIVFKKLLNVKNNPSLSAKEKASRIQKLELKLKKLES